MTYSENENGRAEGDGAPVGEVLGMGRFDDGHNAGPTSPKAPSFEPMELEQYVGTGFELIRLNHAKAATGDGRPLGKAPLKGWRECEPISVEEAREHMAAGANVGVRLRDCDLVVDVDPRNFEPGDEPLRRLQSDLRFRLSDYPQVETGSGGFHFYMRKPEGVRLLDTVALYKGVEFKSLGRQVVSAGSSHPDTGRPYRWDPLTEPLRSIADAPAALIELARRPDSPVRADPGGGRTPEQLEEMLAALDASEFRDEGRWREVMMAAHHATGGDGRDEFMAWSTSDPAYRDHGHVIGRRWDSLHADAAGRRITERTLFMELSRAGRQDLIPRDSAEDDFPDDAPDAPDGALPERPPQQRGGSLADEWVWIAGIERFVRKSDTQKFSEKQFKSMFQHRWKEGEICSAVWKGQLPIRRLESLAYVPSQPEFLTQGDWAGSYNLWRRSGVQAKEGDVSAFLEHMEYLFPDPVERGHVLDYLSLLVADDFVKVHFALLVRGKPGTGKSFLGKLLRKIIGSRNVSMPSSSEVTKEFTGWQEGVQLAILEELMALGRTEVANRLKPVITDDFLRIRLMHTNPYSTPNFLNLLCFTNHRDALPIEPDDRRWLVVFSDAKPRDEAYYERLFRVLDGDGPAAVKHFLQTRKVGLNPKGVAPSTAGKAEMRRLSTGDAEQCLSEMLEEGAAPFDFELVRVQDVVDAIPDDVRRQTKGLRHRVPEWLRESVGAVAHSRYTKGKEAGRMASQLWSIRNHDEWAALGAAGRIDAFLAHTKVIDGR